MANEPENSDHEMSDSNAGQEGESSETKTYDLNNVSDLLALLRHEDEETVKREVQQHVSNILRGNGLDHYRTVFLFDDCDNISRYHSNRIYDAVSDTPQGADILLLINSPGGSIEPAYLISKTCKRLSKDKFVVAVPRRAKSAATLIALGATEIHMGLMSELGPIDPQIGGYPALGLSNALNRVADLTSKFPESTDMFAQFLTKNLSLRDLGYFERVSESAAQYAERLLSDKDVPAPHTPSSLADHFVNHYKDHSFVIDTDEAADLLGSDVVKTDTPEYKGANSVYSFLNFFGMLLDLIRQENYDYVGHSLVLRKRN